MDERPRKRNDTLRQRLTIRYRRTQPACHLCGDPIDYNAHHLDPLALAIDHVIPFSKGGRDTPDNLAPTHRACNRIKGAHIDPPGQLRRSASLTW